MNKSIMPKDNFWSVEYFPGSHKHHIFGGANRNRSEIDGLFIYLIPEMHNMSDKGIHFNRKFELYTKKIAEETWINYYGKTKEDFITEYGKNYI